MALCMLFFSFCRGLMTLLLKYVMMKEEVNPLFATLVRTIIVFCCVTPLDILYDETIPGSTNMLSHHVMVICTFHGWMLDFLFQSTGKESATVVGTFDKASTILTILLSVIFLNEN